MTPTRLDSQTAKSPKGGKAKGAKAPTLYLIAGFKLLKGFSLIALGISTFYLSHQHFDLGEMFDKFLVWINLDPGSKFFNNISDWLTTVTPANLKAVASGTMIYGFFLLVGGTGLAMRAAWAIWLAIGEAAFFIPVELYELVKPQNHHKLGLALVMVVNIIIVVYLYLNRNRLFRHHHA